MPSGCDRTVFDAWVRTSLAATYDGLLREPVPDELLQLVALLAEPG